MSEAGFDSAPSSVCEPMNYSAARGASPQKNFSSQAAGNLTRKNKKMKNLQMIDLAIRDILKKWNNPIFNYI